MSCTKLVLATLALSLATSACAAQAPRLACPATLHDGNWDYPLSNATLFDGPPSEGADLAPASGKTVDRWDLDGVDPYLVCKYAGSSKTVTLHAKGAGSCEAGGKSFMAYCK